MRGDGRFFIIVLTLHLKVGDEGTLRLRLIYGAVLGCGTYSSLFGAALIGTCKGSALRCDPTVDL